MKEITKRISKGFHSLKTKIKKTFTPGHKALTGATLAIFLGFAIALAASTLVYVNTLGWITVLALTISILIFSFVSALLTISLLKLLARIRYWLATALVAGIPVIMMFFHMTRAGSAVVFITIVFCCALTGGALTQFGKRWGKQSSFRKALVMTCLILGIAGISGGLIWLLHPGKPVEMPANAAMSVSNLPKVLEAKNPSEPGFYPVAQLTYGSGKDQRRKEFGTKADLITKTVDGTAFLNSWAGLSGKMRTRYFGFDQTNLPLNATVWYPEGDGPFPLVLIVHGNHLAQGFSDRGYSYLGKLLASRGYVMASVDQNFLNGTYSDIPNGLSNENDARGWLLLKHLQEWQQWNNEKLHPFYQKVDMDRIALIGHSRGGEAVGHAALFNRLPFYPDDANEVFDFNFSIQSVIAIAPSDGQYQPAGIRTPLRDVNYLVIQGSHDADMSSYQGMRQFNRIHFSDDFDGFKAGVYIWGANHGQFNSVWGRTDFPAPRINFYNLAQLMSPEDQKTISCTYISAFLDATLRNERELRKMFMDHRHARHWLPETVYLSQYEQAGTTYICTFAEDLDLTTGTLTQSTIHTNDLSIWWEQPLYLNWGNYDTRAVAIGWNTTQNDTLLPFYSLQWPANPMIAGKNSVLVFSLAESTEKAEPPENEKYESPDLKNNTTQPDDYQEESHEEENDFIDFTIRLADAHGAFMEFPLSSFAPVQPTLRRHFTKLPFMQNQSESETILQFFYFPMEQFAYDHPEFDFENINCISFIFDISREGAILLNNIGFTHNR